ncbi:MAG: hypothetical protein A2016_00385 [Elusimicrobia bacterium GWF2_62_30]|nr:MAG: hypothetical protein A2016_00385 [Elusimicrobia bacterium GWF2_62_30]
MAVLEFPYVGGRASEGPMVVQERLITALSKIKGVTLIERGQLKKVMGELNLQASGAIDDTTAKQLGKLLGADAVVTGTLNDIKEKKSEINARIVETETGKILSAAAVQLEKTWKDAAVVTTVPDPKDPPKDFGNKPLVQVAVLLDTSNSMDGLINQARMQIWKIVNELVTAEKSGSAPAIEVAVYEYGNSALGSQGGYIRQVLPFTRDLDKVSQELFALKTNGGDEYSGWVIKDAVAGLKWSPKEDVYKAIFIAGNEPFTQGPVDFHQAAAAAKVKGIFVNTIFCGSRQQGMAEQWLAGAQAADGDYTNIDQEAAVYTAAAPQDNKISELSARLDGTSVGYGRHAEAKFAARGSMAANYAGAGAGGTAAMADRAAYKAAAPSALAAEEAEWDAVSALESGTVKREELKKDQLPANLQKMSDKERNAFLDKQLADRKKIKDEINALQAQRKVYLAAEEKKRAAGAKAGTLDRAVIDTIRKQATKRGYKFTK